MNNIPPFASLSSSNSAYFFFQIVDCEGRVWSCGNNANGQLGLGDKNERVEFEKIESLPVLKMERGRGKKTKSARNIATEASH